MLMSKSENETKNKTTSQPISLNYLHLFFKTWKQGVYLKTHDHGRFAIGIYMNYIGNYVISWIKTFEMDKIRHFLLILEIQWQGASKIS